MTLAAQFLKRDADLLLCRVTLACRAAEVFDDLLSRRFEFISSWSHHSSITGCEEPKTSVVHSNPYLSHKHWHRAFQITTKSLYFLVIVVFMRWMPVSDSWNLAARGL